MNLFFFEPPPKQKAGGLDVAISSLGAAMTKLGNTVSVNAELPGDSTGAIAHFHGLWQRKFPALARKCMERRIPYVVSPHGMLEPWAFSHKRWKKWPYFHLIEKNWMSRAACILATAEPEAGRLRGMFPRSRVESIPLGLTADKHPDYEAARRKLGWSAGETVLLYLSRIHKKKGLALLLSALARIHGTFSRPLRLVIVGPEEQPGYAAQCRRFARQNAARLPTVDWIGPVWGEDRWTYFQGADLFCLPTHSENFGLAILESCQVGTPVLTTTGTPWAGALAGGRGFIAQPDLSSIQGELVTFLCKPARTPAEREALSRWAWSNFDWAALAPRYAALYTGLR